MYRNCTQEAPEITISLRNCSRSSGASPYQASFSPSWRPVANASAYELAVFRQTTPNNFPDAVVIVDLTKDTIATATQLVPNFNYWAYLWAFNSSGGSMSKEVIFKTPKKP